MLVETEAAVVVVVGRVSGRRWVWERRTGVAMCAGETASLSRAFSAFVARSLSRALSLSLPPSLLPPGQAKLPLREQVSLDVVRGA